MWGNQGGGFGGGFEQGGGFMTNTGFNSPGQSQEKKTRLRSQNIIPCTVAQIIKATQNDDSFKIGEVEVHQISLIGLIRSKKIQSTNITYEIDDCTGPTIEVKQWLEAESFNEDEHPSENTYVRISGNIRSLNNKRHIVAFKIRPLTDMNELTTFLLEIIHTSMSISLGSKNANLNRSVVNNSSAANVMNESSSVTDNAIGGLVGIRKQIFDLIYNHVAPEGSSITWIYQQLRSVPQAAIRNALDFLSQEGHIYSTIDEEHFQCTDC